MLSTVAGFYFYLRPIWVAAIEKSESPVERITLARSHVISLSLLAFATIYFGLLPNSLINISRWVIQNYL